MADLLVGYDTKYDFMAARFKTSFITYCDDSHKGRVGAVYVCNNETADSNNLHLQIIQANIPCNPTCDHERKLYIFNDGNGLLTLRSKHCCALEHSPSPRVQHDKAFEPP